MREQPLDSDLMIHTNLNFHPSPSSSFISNTNAGQPHGNHVMIMSKVVHISYGKLSYFNYLIIKFNNLDLHLALKKIKKWKG